MKRILVVTGTPGAGKTTVLSGIHGKHTLLNIGTLMFEIAHERYKIKDRDEIRAMPPEDILKLRKMVLNRIKNMKGNIILDTHVTIRKGPRIVPGFSERELVNIGDILGFIYIDADAKEIILRRTKDLNRRRDVEDIHDINDQRTINLGILSTLSAAMNMPIYLIKNKKGKLADAIKTANRVVADAFE